MAFALALGHLAGCGLGDSDQAECRCVEDTDLGAFPECADDLAVERADPENPFSSRVPECPSGKRLFLREPTSPEAVLFNIRDSVEGFSPIQYLDQLDERFLFVPDIDAIQLYLEVYNPPDGYNPDANIDTLWTREQERRFILNILDRETFQRIEFDRWFDSSKDERFPSEDPLVEEYRFPYRVTLTEQPAVQDSSIQIVEISGRVDVSLTTPSEENPVWIVTRWQDFRDLASARGSWTELRGEFSQ